MGPTESGMLRDESSRLAIVSSGFHSPLRRQRRAGPMVRAPAEFRTPYGSFRPDADGHHQSASGADSLEWFRPDTRARVHERCRRGPQGDARCQVSPLEGGLVPAHVRLSGIWPGSPRGAGILGAALPLPSRSPRLQASSVAVRPHDHGEPNATWTIRLPVVLLYASHP
jgi:hypothetical protein